MPTDLYISNSVAEQRNSGTAGDRQVCIIQEPRKQCFYT